MIINLDFCSTYQKISPLSAVYTENYSLSDYRLFKNGTKILYIDFVCRKREDYKGCVKHTAVRKTEVVPIQHCKYHINWKVSGNLLNMTSVCLLHQGTSISHRQYLKIFSSQSLHQIFLLAIESGTEL